MGQFHGSLSQAQPSGTQLTEDLCRLLCWDVLSDSSALIFHGVLLSPCFRLSHMLTGSIIFSWSAPLHSGDSLVKWTVFTSCHYDHIIC